MTRAMDQTQTQQRSIVPWPEFLGPRPGLKEINLLCWAVFTLCVVAPACIVLGLQLRSGNLYFTKSPVDFVYLYGTGQIANTHPAIDVYNYGLQLAEFNKIQPLDHGTYGPSPYPPFVSQFFRLFALMSFETAFLVWLGVSLVLYLSGVLLAVREFFPEDRLKQALILCFALASSAFLLNTLGNGQLSSVGLFALSSSIVLERRGRPFSSGLALALMAYKPTLLLFVLPMLILTRRLKTLGGFVAGGGVLAAISTAIAGVRIWPTYLHFLNSFGKTSGVYGESSLRLWKYVDLNSFSYAVPEGRSRLALVLLACIAVGAVSWSAVALWRSSTGDNAQRNLTWAVAITWTMLVNVYFPIYDSILIVIVVIVALAALRDLHWSRAFEWMVLLGVAEFAIGWFTEPVARQYGVQLLTLVILAIAVSLTIELQRAGKPTESRMRPASMVV